MEYKLNEAEEKKEILNRYKTLLKACRRRMEKGDKETIRKAFELAVDAHKHMRRKSGEPYIYHPIAVAQICAEEIGLGTTSIVCLQSAHELRGRRVDQSRPRFLEAVGTNGAIVPYRGARFTLAPRSITSI